MNRPEENLHRAVLAYLRAALPKPWIVWHTPNGGGRSAAEAGILKAMGVLAGMPDLFVLGPPVENNTAFPLFAGETPEAGAKRLAMMGPRLIAIELKAPPKRLRSGGVSKASPRLSPAQVARRVDLNECGVPYILSDDLADVIQQLRALHVPLRGRAI